MLINSTIIQMIFDKPFEEIKCNFTILSGDKVILEGRATINIHKENIKIDGNLVNMPNFDSDDYRCSLFNLPIYNRKENLSLNDIIIDFPRIKLISDFELKMSSNTQSEFEGSFVPLYQTRGGENIMTIKVLD